MWRCPLSTFSRRLPWPVWLALLTQHTKQIRAGDEASGIVPIPREGLLPASIAQEHFWLFDQMLPGLPLFNIPYVIRLVGTLNVTVLEQSFDEILRRHEALRTTFASVDGQLVQLIAPTFAMALTVRDLTDCPRPNEKVKPCGWCRKKANVPST